MGDVVFFDSGEYVSKYGNSGSYRQEVVNGETRIGDYFEIDFGPTESEIRPDTAGNKGGRANTWKNASGVDLSNSLPNYPRGQATDGKSSILTTIVNDPHYEEVNDDVKPAGTLWKLSMDLVRKPVLGPETLTTSEGLQYQMQTKGFNSLSRLSLTDSVSAADALEMTMREQDNLRYQMG